VKRAKRNMGKQQTTASDNLGFEDQLWASPNALRGSMDAAEYKHVVLGLIILKYISDAFEAHHAKLEAERDQGADPEDPDEYRAEGIFWVPPEARWSELQKNARQPTIDELVDRAMAVVERDNPSLKGVLSKDYARHALDKTWLGHAHREVPRPVHQPESLPCAQQRRQRAPAGPRQSRHGHHLRGAGAAL